MMSRYVQDPNISVNIVFLDEATFTLHEQVSRHNCRYWSDENPHWITPYSDNPKMFNVYAGIVGNNIVGSFIINGNLN